MQFPPPWVPEYWPTPSLIDHVCYIKSNTILHLQCRTVTAAMQSQFSPPSHSRCSASKGGVWWHVYTSLCSLTVRCCLILPDGCFKTEHRKHSICPLFFIVGDVLVCRHQREGASGPGLQMSFTISPAC